MAAGTTGVAQLDNLRRTFLRECRAVEDHKAVMIKLVARQTLPHHQGVSLNMPYIGSITAVSLTDSVEFDAPSQITDTNVAFTPAEVGAQILWTKKMGIVISENFPKLAADLMTGALEYKIDTDLLTQLDSFGGIFGAAGTAFTHGLAASAVSAVREGRTFAGTSGTVTARTGARTTGDPPTGQPISIVLHERNHYDLQVQYGGLAAVAQGSALAVGTAQSSVGSGGTGDYEARWRETHQTGFRIGGAMVYVDNNLTIDGSDDIKGGVFAKEAMQFIDLQGLQEYQVRTVDGRAVRHTLWRDYAVGEYNDAWGRELYVDAVGPAA